MTEIEIKARVTDPIFTEAKIRTFACFLKTIKKSDIYWKQESTGLKIRLRTEQIIQTESIGDPNDTIVTYKKKQIQNKTEVNEEYEFSITERSSFEAFLHDLNFIPYIEKTKETLVFSYLNSTDFPVLIELSYIPLLGYFIEIEIMSEKKDKEYINKAREVLFSTLKTCEIPETNIETRFYTDMLKEVSHR